MIAGDCYFDQKAYYAQQAGAAAALVFDNVMGAYFTLGSNKGETSLLHLSYELSELKRVLCMCACLPTHCCPAAVTLFGQPGASSAAQMS